MYTQALQGYEEALGPVTVARYRPALNTVWNLGNLFNAQGELTEAKTVLSRAFNGFQDLLGPSSDECEDLERALASLHSSKSKFRKVVQYTELSESFLYEK
jgi:hypothetical protein